MCDVFKYNTAIYDTWANPLQVAQLKYIFQAASESKELYIVLNYNIEKDSISYKVRYRWLRQLTSQFDNINIILLDANSKNKENYLSEKIKKKIDAIYSKKQDFFKDAKFILVEDDLETSSFEIHNNPFKYWDIIPKVIRPYYIKKVLIIGNESSGKSVLAESLAKIYNSEFVEEYSREVCLNCGGEDYMLDEDFEEILLQHKLNIDNKAKTANKLLFIDTDGFMSYYYRNQCNLDSQNKKYLLDDEKIIQKISRDYDLVFYMESDVPYVDDELRIVDRNKDGEREIRNQKIKDIYLKNGINYEILSGNYKNRLIKAQKLINEKFNL